MQLETETPLIESNRNVGLEVVDVWTYKTIAEYERIYILSYLILLSVLERHTSRN